MCKNACMTNLEFKVKKLGNGLIRNSFKICYSKINFYMCFVLVSWNCFSLFSQVCGKTCLSVKYEMKFSSYLKICVTLFPLAFFANRGIYDNYL